MIITILIIALGYSLIRLWNWKLSATVLAAWIAENNYAPPEKNDCERLKSWVVHKWFKIN